jgi:GxxExxY protein
MRTHVPESVEKLATMAVGSAYKVHSELGPGLLESAYEYCLIHELQKRGLKVDSQVNLPIFYDNTFFNMGYRIDILVDNNLIIEVKAVEEIIPIHVSQLVTYLRFSGHRLGLIINFNTRLFKDSVKRVVK